VIPRGQAPSREEDHRNIRTIIEHITDPYTSLRGSRFEMTCVVHQRFINKLQFTQADRDRRQSGKSKGRGTAVLVNNTL